jgi:hypothetical protein
VSRGKRRHRPRRHLGLHHRGQQRVVARHPNLDSTGNPDGTNLQLMSSQAYLGLSPNGATAGNGAPLAMQTTPNQQTNWTATNQS